MAVLFSVLSPQSALCQLHNEREALEYAQVLYSDGLYGTAAEEYRRFILNYPTSERLAQARLRLADAYLLADSLESAVDAYQIFVDRHPNNIEVATALRSRARALEKLSKHNRAAEAFGELYERFTTGEYAVQDLLSAGTNARKAKNFTTSEKLFRTILTSHPSSPLVHEATYNLSLVLIDQGQESESLLLLESIRNSEREPDALLEIGRIALSQDDLQKSERTFSSLRRRFSKSKSAESSYLVLGAWYENQLEWEKAIATYEGARKARLGTGTQQQIILGLARVYRASGKDALQLYTQFLEMYPRSPFLPDARLGLGRSYVDKGQYQQAIEGFKRLQESFPDHPYSVAAHRDIGDVYATLNSPRRALAAYRRHLTLSPNPEDSTLTELRMGGVYRKLLGWSDIAVDIFSQLSKNENRNVAGPAQFQLGQTYEAAGKNNLALREYRVYLERFAGQTNAHQAENRIRYLTTYAPRGPVDRELVDLIGLGSNDFATRLRLGRLLFERRYFDEAVSHLEAAVSDTIGGDAIEAAFLLAQTLVAIDRRDAILHKRSPRHGDRVLSIFSQISANAKDSEFADDAAFRALEIKHPAAIDTALAKTRIDVFEQFLKSHPNSNKQDDARLIQAETHLDLGSKLPDHLEQALAIYNGITTRHTSSNYAEKAGYGIGRCLAIKRDYVRAENALRAFLFEFPNSDLEEEARFQLGLILLERGYLQSAAEEFVELLAAPTSVDLERSTRALLAECYFRLEDFESAISIDETLLDRGAEPAVLKRLGEAYTRTGNEEKALSVLGTFVRKFSASPGADTLSFKRAELLAELGRTDQAIGAFKTLSTTFPKSKLTVDGMASVARLEFQKQNYTAALDAIPESAGLKNAIIGELRIVTLLRLDRAKQARKEIKTFKKIFPKQVEALARFQVEEARLQLRYGNPKGAKKTLEGVIKNYNQSQSAEDAEFYLIGAIEKVGKPEEHLDALVSFVKNRSRNVHWAKANMALAEIYDANQDYVSASRSYANALKGELGENERPQVLELLFKSHRNLRSYDSAIAYARELIEQYPHDPKAQDARVTIGQMYNEKGAYVDAINELLPLLTKLQGDPWSSAQELIAVSYERQGDYESALREYLKLIYNHQGSVNWIANAFMGRARCFDKLGKTTEAIGELEKIVARFNGDSFAQGAQAKINELRQKQNKTQ
ncbi:MAG: tetratricopeptide repeat protein [Candidatus Latescibacterota bacterium]|nr:tetratricopeptide repeat protein [Candidatus Latescibacterota bacterium]